MWPQISVLGGRRKDGTVNDSSGIFEDEEEFMSKYVLKGDRGDEIGTKSRLAELHTLLTSTIMIRRMKVSDTMTVSFIVTIIFLVIPNFPISMSK